MINNIPEIEQIIADIRQSGIAALDTEFVWQRSLRPILGVVQLADASGNSSLWDARAPHKPAKALADLLHDTATVKILHDARQDLELLWQYCAGFPRNIFDTRLAAGFAGYSSTTSLKNLLHDALEIELPQEATLTDWTRRPLTARQLEYAHSDVRYLPRLREHLLGRAAELGTDRWLAEELQTLDDPSLYPLPPPEHLWQTVKGREQLTVAGLNNLRSLAAAREQLAMQRDLPRQWIARDASLVEIAHTPPADLPELGRRRLLDRRQFDTMGPLVMQALAEAATVPESDYPANDYRNTSAVDKTLLKEVRHFLTRRAAEIRLDPILLGSRAEVAHFLLGHTSDAPLSSGWRWEVAGSEIARRWQLETP